MINYRLAIYALIVCYSQLVASIQHETENTDMVFIEVGSYTPLFKQDGDSNELLVDAFYLDRYQVTNKQFDQFIRQKPKWSRKEIKPIFADQNYLKQFADQSMLTIANQPVINISWFSARAYCKSVEKRLPTLNEWEYVAQASKDKANGSDDPNYHQQILEWYAKSSYVALPDVKQAESNYWGAYGMHGVVWELVNDFNTSLVTGESRGDSQLEQQLFCGAGAASSIDPNDYAAFMRYALRSSYEANYTLSSLGFRCARDTRLKYN